MDYGEQTFLQSTRRLCYTPSDMKSELFDAGLNWQDVQDFDFFLMTYKALSTDDYSLILNEYINFNEMVVFTNNMTGQKFLAYELSNGQPDLDNVIIDHVVYYKITEILRKTYGFKRSCDIASNKYTMRYLIDDDRRKKEKYRKSPPEFESVIMPLIITIVNTTECSQTSDELLHVGFYKLITDLNQIAKSKSALSLVQARLTGMVDMSSVDKSNFNWMYESVKQN